MNWADIAVAAAGITSWEIAFVGLPALTIVTAENQAATAALLENEGAVINLGAYPTVGAASIRQSFSNLQTDPQRRRSMSERARGLVDGRGTQRVLARLMGMLLQLRRVTQQDSRLVWTWANDSAARAASFSSDSIPWESHANWFAAKLRDRNCFFYIATHADGIPIGDIRFDLKDREAVVSINLAPEARGRGAGPALISQGADAFFAEADAELIHAYVKFNNAASVSAFVGGDFFDAGTVEINGHRARHFMRKKAIL
jgi:UDP-2,4-diacetamido-2,4,6-trideoxy-beta-L-altropyranose hydrolase